MANIKSINRTREIISIIIAYGFRDIIAEDQDQMASGQLKLHGVLGIGEQAGNLGQRLSGDDKVQICKVFTGCGFQLADLFKQSKAVSVAADRRNRRTLNAEERAV